jgi:hypothetical protein
MTLLTVSLPTTGTARGSEEVDVGNALAAILADYNGSITPENLKNGGVAENWVLPALAAKLGLASRAATQTVVQTMATGWQSPIGVSITQPDPGFTLPTPSSTSRRWPRSSSRAWAIPTAASPLPAARCSSAGTPPAALLSTSTPPPRPLPSGPRSRSL